MSQIQQGQLILVSGESATGKSASLRNIPNQERWAYSVTESGKALPFPNKFQTGVVTDPYQLQQAFEYVTESPDMDGIIVDSVTFLMDMYETNYVINAQDGRQAWQEFAQFFKIMMNQWVPAATMAGKHVIFTAHTRTEQDAQLIDRVSVPIKGALKNSGVESYFSTVVSTKSMPIDELKDYNSSLLNITEDDELLGFKYVFQTKLTKATIGERIRGPMGLFSNAETFMDNDVAKLLDHMVKFYAPAAP